MQISKRTSLREDAWAATPMQVPVLPSLRPKELLLLLETYCPQLAWLHHRPPR
jgi:hypothetical protein